MEDTSSLHHHLLSPVFYSRPTFLHPFPKLKTEAQYLLENGLQTRFLSFAFLLSCFLSHMLFLRWPSNLTPLCIIILSFTFLHLSYSHSRCIFLNFLANFFFFLSLKYSENSFISDVLSEEKELQDSYLGLFTRVQGSYLGLVVFSFAMPGATIKIFLISLEILYENWTQTKLRAETTEKKAIEFMIIIIFDYYLRKKMGNT